MPLAYFDRAARYLIREWPLGFFLWLSLRFAQAWRFRGWLDTSVPGESDDSERICDLVAEFENIAEPARRSLLEVEAQTRPHADMPERLGEYAYRLRRERRYGRGRRGKYQVLSVLLNLTGAVQPNVLDMTEETLDGAGLHIDIVQRTLREEDAAATLRRIASGDFQRCILPWIPLMRSGGDAGIIEEWKRLASLERNADRRADYGAIALTFAELAKRKGVWQAGLEDWNVKESRFLAGWEKRGMDKGELKRQRKALLRALQLRLQNPLPTDLVSVVNASEDLDELERWFDLSQTANTLAEFRAQANV
jgi:hypothetical protein